MRELCEQNLDPPFPTSRPNPLKQRTMDDARSSAARAHGLASSPCNLLLRRLIPPAPDQEIQANECCCRCTARSLSSQRQRRSGTSLSSTNLSRRDVRYKALGVEEIHNFLRTTIAATAKDNFGGPPHS